MNDSTLNAEETLTANEKAYDKGYDDSLKGHWMIDYSEWCEQGYEGNHSSYKAGFEDAERDNFADNDSEDC